MSPEFESIGVWQEFPIVSREAKSASPPQFSVLFNYTCENSSFQDRKLGRGSSKAERSGAERDPASAFNTKEDCVDNASPAFAGHALLDQG